MELYEEGHRDFGENYVQELLNKHESLPKDIRWHFIGHLQTNKVKYLAPFVHLIHSVDSLKLVSEINKQGLKNNRIISCLIQSYVGKEETKFGLSPNEVKEILGSKECMNFPSVSIEGLMGMASHTENDQEIAEEFSQLRKLFEESKAYLSTHIRMEVLSMGMSSDYVLAIKAGSTMIRVGSLIFGERNYQK